MLSACLLYGGLALTYDIQFGFTGLLSFGHALYIALGAYLANIAITDWHWSFWPSILFTVGRLGRARECPRIRVTPCQRHRVRNGHTRVRAGGRGARPQGSRTTGRTAKRVSAPTTPSFRRHSSASSTRRTSTGSRSAFLAVVFFVVRWAVDSSPGRIWQAIRENEQRVEILGLRPRAYKLQAFVLSSTLAAAGGIVYMLLYSGSTLTLTQPNFTLTLLLMVVIGGAGSRWGAVLGGILYTYVNDRLIAVGSSSAVQGLPHALRTPLEQPLFLLGIVFILIVVFLPGGLAGLVSRGRPSGLRRARGGSSPGGAHRGAAKSASPRRLYDRGDSRAECKIAYEVLGGRRAARPRARARVRAPRLGAVPRAAHAELQGRRSSTTAVSAEAMRPKGPTLCRRWRMTSVAVLDDAGIERTNLFGVSLGGYIAQELTLAHPERIEKLVLASTAPGGPRAHPMPPRGLEAFGRYPTMEREAGLRLMVENSLGERGVRGAPAARRGDLRVPPRARALGRRHGRHRPSRARPSTRTTGSARSPCRPSLCRAAPTTSSIRATRSCSAS